METDSRGRDHLARDKGRETSEQVRPGVTREASRRVVRERSLRCYQS